MTVKVPPLKCQGIKTKLVEWIKDHAILEEAGTWIEPFMGSGVVGFNVRPDRAIFADVNPHIVNFYHAIKDGKITVGIAKEFLEKEGALLQKKGENHYYEVRERFNKNGNSLDMLFLNRACFNGVMRFNKKGAFNVPFGHKPEYFAKAYITKITNQIKYVADALSQYDWQLFVRISKKRFLLFHRTILHIATHRTLAGMWTTSTHGQSRMSRNFTIRSVQRQRNLSFQPGTVINIAQIPLLINMLPFSPF